jgi:S-phase kinase-associated protein 1
MEEEQKQEKVRMVHLLPGDKPDEPIVITYKAAIQSELIKSMVSEDDEDETSSIPLLEVMKEELEKVVVFLNKHVDDPYRLFPRPITSNNAAEMVGQWDADFINLEQDKLFKLILAANYLDIPSLLDLGIGKVACMVKGKDPDEVKTMFNIQSTPTPEEEKQVRSENEWIFDVSPATTSATTAGGAN